MSALNNILRALTANPGGQRQKRRVPARRKRRTLLARARTMVLRPKMRAATIPASVNTASRIRSGQTKSMSLFSNTDRLIQLTLPANAAKGTVIYDQVITPAIASRLRTQASLFQKIEYVSLRFQVQTQTPTTNGGGYVAAFLHDPMMDIGSGEAALRALTAVQGTQTSKFWQSIDLNVKTTKQQYFTLQGEDVRLFSPGRFVVLSDGPPTNAVSITILFHWTVRLTRPALQRLAATFPQVVVTASLLYSNGEKLRLANWNPVTNVFTPALGSTDAPAYDMGSALYGLPSMAAIGTRVLWYKLPAPFGPFANQDARFLSVRVEKDHYAGRLHSWPHDAYVISGSTKDNFVNALMQGDRLVPCEPDEFAGAINNHPFLVMASPSVSINRQPHVSKTLLTLPPIESETQFSQDETVQDRLLRTFRLD